MEIKLNREAWEPCEYCNNKRRILTYDGAGDSAIIVIGNSLAAIEADTWGFLVSYCPKCGRPLTDAAWAELEERLRRCAE